MMSSVTSRGDDYQRFVTDGLLRSIKEIMEVNQGMPAAQIYVLLLVALNEGKSLVELSQMSGLRQATMSRYLLDLSDKLRDGSSGFKLVNRETDPVELRKNMYSLAPKGRHLIKSLCENF